MFGCTHLWLNHRIPTHSHESKRSKWSCAQSLKDKRAQCSCLRIEQSRLRQRRHTKHGLAERAAKKTNTEEEEERKKMKRNLKRQRATDETYEKRLLKIKIFFSPFQNSSINHCSSDLFSPVDAAVVDAAVVDALLRRWDGEKKK